MPSPLAAPELFEREFLEIRARLLHLASSLDRIGRAEGTVDGDPRLDKIRQGLAVLSDGKPDRAERIQMIFSRAYDADWQAALSPRNTNGQEH
jgi:hypothetical protein